MTPDPIGLWEVLPKRGPGMIAPTVALRFPGVDPDLIRRRLEAMVVEGWAMRVNSRRRDHYYRGQQPPAPEQSTLPATPEQQGEQLWIF